MKIQNSNQSYHVRPGSLIEFLIPAGIGLNGQEWTKIRGKVLFQFGTHLTCNGGGKYGIPYVVDEENFLRVIRY